MAKKSNKANKKHTRASNTEWLEGNLERTILDLDALSSMSIDDVHEELNAQNASSNAAFIQALNQKLPDGVNVKSNSPSQKRKRRSRPAVARPAADRSAKKAPASSGLRIFSLRNAFILSSVIIVGALLVPSMIRVLQDSEPKEALIADSLENDENEPTIIEGSFEELKLRGVRYTAENFNPLVPEIAPLPPNPDSMEAVLQFRVTVDSSGSVKRLVSLDLSPNPLEKAVIDSLLLWKFEPDQSTTDKDSTTGILTIIYFKE